MSLSFAGIGLLSPWSPLRFWDYPIHTRAGFRSFICALVVVAVLLILAYLTNPTEISFRAYLTEQSFRQHLSHLDDLADDSAPGQDSADSRSRPHRSNPVDRATLRFHFANRASVSLRTPKHVLHSFAICTIATTGGATLPASPRRVRSEHNHSSDLDVLVSSDSWFIGAFGRWWRGGLVQPWYYDAMIRSKDTHGWSSGILGFKALDKFHDYDALSFTKFASYPRPLLRGSPPKLRNRERSTQRSGSVTHRNSSPPPLPKSVSLPLHADHRLHDFLPATPQSSHSVADQKRITARTPPVAHTISRTPSISGASDHSPSIVDISQQIAAAQDSVHNLQNQLLEAQNAANQSRDSLEAELGDLRVKKREEEQRRIDGRARTKTLEETRRLAEATKREAEKKMKIARNAKDSAMRRVEELEFEIQALKERMEHDRTVLSAEPNNEDTKQETELIRELERKKKEVQVAEEVATALNTRARELEEKIDESKSRLRAAQHRAQLAKTYPISTDISHWDSSVVNQCSYAKMDNSRSSSYNPFDVPVDVLASSVGSERVKSDNESSDALHSLNLAGFTSVSDYFDNGTSCVDLTPLSGHGQSGYFRPSQATTFSPFYDPPTPSAAFIPSSLISVLDSPSADWKGGSGTQNGSLTASPIEYTGHTLKAESEHDLSDLCAQSSYDQPSVLHGTALYETRGSEDLLENSRKGKETKPGWLSVPRNEKLRSGLNPDAKVFRLTRFTPDKTGSVETSVASALSYDALNPTGLASRIPSSTPSSLLRAFAPSRAEREALQRALGGSTNTSLERLPSLSDVGSIPSSTGHTQAEAARGRSIGEKDCVLPTWLQSFPLIRKPNFSPWEDEDLVSPEVKRK